MFEPSEFQQAKKDDKQMEAMEELKLIENNDTEDKPQNREVVEYNWVQTIK